MPRPKKNARYLNVYIESSIADQIDRFAKQTGIPKSRLVERAVTEYMERHMVLVDGERKYTI